MKLAKQIGKWLFIVTGTVAIALWVVAFGLLFTQPEPVAVENEAHKVVREVCVYAYQQNDGESEEACAIAQRVSGTEFLCTSERCWVEVDPYAGVE